VYRVITDPSVLDQIDALPDDALRAYAEVVTVLEVAPAEAGPTTAISPTDRCARWCSVPKPAAR
jgi:hypothetical protein